MNKVDGEILSRAASVLKSTIGFPVIIKKPPRNKPDAGIDAQIEIQIYHQKFVLNAQIEKEFRNVNLMLFRQKGGMQENKLIIVDSEIPRPVRENLRTLGISYLDGSGHIFLRSETLLVLVEPEKGTKSVRGLKYFSKSSLKVIYQFLANPSMVNQTYREISRAAAVSLGTIPTVMENLRRKGFLIPKRNGKQELKNQRELLAQWILGYEDRLRPSLSAGRFRFSSAQEEEGWRNLELRSPLTLWGGEPAAALMTNYLTPQVFTLYSSEPKAELIRKYHFLPDSNGNIEVLHQFGGSDGIMGNTVHPLLVYADLALSSPRNRETAQIIFEKYLDAFF